MANESIAPISRDEARELGLKRFGTGVPCCNGHLAQRYVSSGVCCECTMVRAQTWKNSHRENVRSGNREYRQSNKDKLNAYSAKRYKENPEYCKQYIYAWSAANRHRVVAKDAKRRAIRLLAIPAWANAEAIAAIYKEAGRLGMEVDHVIPLQGKLVCGLHVENNLQLLTKSENSAKGNRIVL